MDEFEEKDETKAAAGAKGGKARAEVLSPEERREIARRAAAARWGEVPTATWRKATHSGVLTIGEMRIPVAVLDDHTRVISETGLTKALLGTRSGASRRARMASLEAGTPIPLFLAPGNLKPFISEDLMSGTLKPIIYEQNGRPTVGFSADILPAACDVWLKAREAGELYQRQADKAQRAEILLRGLAKVGITALIDEVTGYQEVRDRDALAKILEQFIATELRKWVKTFPIEYYRELFRLRGWDFDPTTTKRGPLVGKLTNNLVYLRLAPGVLEELKRLTPKDDRGRRKTKLFQRLTEDVGHPRLREHLSAVIALMKAAPDRDWNAFIGMLDRALPKYPKRFNPDQATLKGFEI